MPTLRNFPLVTHTLASIIGFVLSVLIVVPLMSRHQAAVAIATERHVSAALVQAHNRVRAIETRTQHEVAAISNQFENNLQYEKTHHAAVVADLRAGTLRLRIPVNSCSGNPGTAIAGGAEIDHETGTAELSYPAAEFLVGLASEADEVAAQLTACQSVLVADRKMMNPKPTQE